MPLVVAHPLTEAAALPVSPAVVATLAALACVAGWRATFPAGGRSRPGRAGPAGAAGAGAAARSAPAATGAGAAARSAPGTPATAWIALGLLVLVVAAGRTGSARELDNLLPALVVAVVWPALVVASLVAGPVWHRVDPFDALARLVRAPDGEPGPPDVRAALPAAVLWTGYLAVWPTPLAPRDVAAVLAVYALVTAAACLVVGRRRWLAQGEAVGVLLGLLGRARRPGTVVPRGAAVLVGLVGGGLAFGLLRGSVLWAGVAFGPGAAWWRVGGFLACAAAGAGLVVGLDRLAARRGAAGAAVVAALPAVGGLALALSLARNRLTTAVQLGLGLGSGELRPLWVPFARAGDEQGLRGLAVVQVVVLVAAALAGVAAARRRTPRRAAQAPGVAAAATLAAAGALLASAV